VVVGWKVTEEKQRGSACIILQGVGGKKGAQARGGEKLNQSVKQMSALNKKSAAVTGRKTPP